MNKLDFKTSNSYKYKLKLPIFKDSNSFNYDEEISINLKNQ